MKKLISVLLVLALLLPCAFAGAEYSETGMNAVLDRLGEDSYTAAYEALLDGARLEKGASGDHAKALQSVLKAFGESVSVDGKAGSGFFKALNAVQARYGMETTAYVDAEVFAELLCALLVYQEGKDAEDAVLEAGFNEDEYHYCLASKEYSDGRYYRAKTHFEASGWADWAERADKCVKDWPKDGRVWKSNTYGGSGALLKLRVRNSDSNVGHCFKVYNSDNKLVAVLFIGGNGKAETSLKPGTYTIKEGTGYEWYGRKDAFGSAGSYCTMTFDGETTLQFKSGYYWEITTGVYDGNGGSYYEDWDNF